MRACVFFGYRDFDYSPYKEKLYEICEKLIVEQKVAQFYTGGRGDFDRMAYETVVQLKKRYANVKLTLFLSYMPKENVKPMDYDDTECVLDRHVCQNLRLWKRTKRWWISRILSLWEFTVSTVARMQRIATRKERERRLFLFSNNQKCVKKAYFFEKISKTIAKDLIFCAFYIKII